VGPDPQCAINDGCVTTEKSKPMADRADKSGEGNRESAPLASLAEPSVVVSEIEEIGPSRRQDRAWLLRLISILIILGAWEILGRRVSPIFMSYPTAIAIAAARMIRSGELLDALWQSLRTLLLGFCVAAISGVAIGLLMGRYRAFDAATDWLVNALYSTPLVAVVPLVILWFGLGFKAKFFIVVILAIFPILINTASGVRNVPRQLIDVGTAFAASEREIFTKIILPAALPYMVTGLRLGIGRAIIGIVVAEFFTAITGLGALIVKYGNQYDTASMFVPILVLMLLGVAFTDALRRVEEWIAPWRHADEE
jgi:NitT/TauT family transport system permease protein